MEALPPYNMYSHGEYGVPLCCGPPQKFHSQKKQDSLLLVVNLIYGRVGGGTNKHVGGAKCLQK